MKMRPDMFRSTISSFNKGFTLVEIVLSLVIMGLAGVIGGLFMSRLGTAYLFSTSNQHLSQKAQVALTRLMIDLGNPSVSISASSSSSISYSMPGGQSIVVSRNAAILRYQVNGTNYTLTDSICSTCVSPSDPFGLTYYDGDGNASAFYTAGTTKRIRMRMTFSDANLAPRTFEESVFMMEQQ